MTTTSPAKPAVRRRASRAAGPAKGTAAESTAVRVDITKPTTEPPKRVVRRAAPPSRRRPNSRLVAICAAALLAVGVVAVAAGSVVLLDQQREVLAEQQRDQRYVDTAKQTVVNMFSFKQDNVEDSVDRFYGATSGPLRDMLSQNNNVQNLKDMFRATGGSSEAVINGAALESIDEISDNASVLVSVRVTVSDLDGNNRPSQPYRMRIVVHEDDKGQMTVYDLKYPNGGN